MPDIEIMIALRTKSAEVNTLGSRREMMSIIERGTPTDMRTIQSKTLVMRRLSSIRKIIFHYE